MAKAALIGLGTMGPGIAATLARAGYEVAAFDRDAGQREKAPAAIAMAASVLDNLGVAVQGGAPVRVADSLADAVAGCGLVIENVSEKLEVKIAVFREIEAAVAKDCIIASDTSGIPITKIQGGVASPERVIGMHWSNPPHIIPMIEVIPGAKTAKATTEAMVAIVKRLGHLPVLIKKDVPGFVENRVLYSIMRECVDLVEQGVIEPEALDTCVSWGIGYKLAVVGPMALLDMAGLDIYQAVGSYLNKELCDRDDVAGYVTERTAKGKLGVKTGSGIFDYTPEGIAELRAARAKKLVAVRKALQA
ncbi:MAG TPA: 3-hydroxyacyl-CoA dehydrogenase NAD-binding domain-containing protein [Candidatus Binatia bacterium]|nr:3-hydroxyacyl-CoA dehydrogenase NAD-binding domain-containing protein [Candidatus Binatia bacterium]